MYVYIKDLGYVIYYGLEKDFFCFKLKLIKFKFLQDIYFNNSDIYILDVC